MSAKHDALGETEFAALVLEHAGFVFRSLAHLGVAKDEIEDASQEVFVIVAHRLGSFEGRSSLRTWLYGVARNVALGFRRKRRDAREIPCGELPETVMQPAQEGELWIRRAHELLVQALDALDDEHRQVFVLFEIEQVPMEEIASSLEIPVSTAYSRLYAARERVQAELRRRTAFASVARKGAVP